MAGNRRKDPELEGSRWQQGSVFSCCVTTTGPGVKGASSQVASGASGTGKPVAVQDGCVLVSRRQRKLNSAAGVGRPEKRMPLGRKPRGNRGTRRLSLRG